MLVIGNLWISVLFTSWFIQFVRFEMHVLLLRNSITDTKIQKSQQQPLFQLTARNLKLLFYFVLCRLFCTPERVQQTFIQETSSSLSGHLSSFYYLKSTFRNQPAELLFTNKVLLVSSEDSQRNYLSVSQDNFLLLLVTPIQVAHF